MDSAILSVPSLLPWTMGLISINPIPSLAWGSRSWPPQSVHCLALLQAWGIPEPTQNEAIGTGLPQPGAQAHTGIFVSVCLCNVAKYRPLRSIELAPPPSSRNCGDLCFSFCILYWLSWCEIPASTQPALLLTCVLSTGAAGLFSLAWDTLVFQYPS